MGEASEEIPGELTTEISLPLEHKSPVANAQTSMTETILYEDVEDSSPFLYTVNDKFITSPRVIVTAGRLKVGTDSYSFADVTNVKVNTTFEPQHRLTFPMGSKWLRILAWSCVGVGLVGVTTVFLPLVLLPSALILSYFVGQMSIKEEIESFWVAKLMLGHPSQTDTILIAIFSQYPDDLMSLRMKNRGYSEGTPEAWRQENVANRQRVQKIVEAVGVAIAKRGGDKG